MKIKTNDYDNDYLDLLFFGLLDIKQLLVSLFIVTVIIMAIAII